METTEAAWLVSEQPTDGGEFDNGVGDTELTVV